MSARLTAQETMLRSITEAEWQRTVQDMLTATGWIWFHAPDNRPGKNGRVQNIKAGYPDLTAARGDRLIFIELKRETGRTTPEQIKWLTALADTGHAETYIFRPSDVARVAQVLAPNWAA